MRHFKYDMPILLHSISTLSGNSGSPILKLKTMQDGTERHVVVSIHQSSS